MHIESLRKPGRGRNRFSALLGTIVVLGLLLVGPSGALALLQAAATSPSPAQGHAQVIAQGDAAMPANSLAWRVVQDTAEPNETAQPETRALGFALADANAIVVNNLTLGTQTRLAPGEASFVGDGETEHRASLTNGNVSYYRIALVSADDANDAGGDQMIFAGDGFSAPDGVRDIDLVRDVLAANEQTQITGSGSPILVFATDGTIEVATGGQTTTLNAGDAGQFSGSLTISASGGTATFVAGVIGPSVPAPPRFTGTITLGVFACPADVTADDLTGAKDSTPFESCDLVTKSFSVSLQAPDGDKLSISDAVKGDKDNAGLYTWQGLAFGDYTIGDPSRLPEGYTDALLFDADLNAMDNGDIAISRDNPDIRVNYYLVAAPTASITVTVFTCPQDMTPDTLAADSCTPAEGKFAVNVTGAGDLNLTLDDATKKNDAYTWSGLSLGKDQKATFKVAETTLPDGFSSYVIVGSQTGQPNAPYETTLSADQPDADLGIYNFTSRAGGGGSITLTGYICPSADSSAEDCQANGTVALDGAVITASGGQQLKAADANRDGDAFSWPIVPFDTYTLDGSSIVPSGDTLVSVSGADGPTDNGGYTFEISATSPTASIAVYLVGQGNGGGAQPTATVMPTATAGAGTPTDSDGDGVSDADEATLGTDPTLVDTDGDCHSDGAEVAAGTNPLDASSFPNGDCDVASQ
jgi:hypothetical protein